MKNWKRILATIPLVIMMLVVSVMPVMADAPTIEEWDCFGFRNGSTGETGTITMLINTATLKSTQFNIYNNTNDYVYFAVVDNEWTVIADVVVAPYTTSDLKINLNFQRLPATDPDDPDSIRMPKDTVFWCQYPTDKR